MFIAWPVHCVCSLFPHVGPTPYVAERRGNLRQLLDIWSAQHRYMEAYYSAIVPMSAEDGIEGHSLLTMMIWAGEEFAHLFPFRSKLVRGSELAGLRNADMDELRERYEQWPYMKGTRAAIGVSADGLVGCSASGIDVQVWLIYCPHVRSLYSTTCGTPTCF